jgi:DNA N-6-adenine-methyltransferase (Dam)
MQPITDTWQTPAHVLALARQVMGAIDTDPASSAAANRTVGATTFYTVEQDGLTRDWPGRVWCNPPYSKVAGVSLAVAFLTRLLEQYHAGITTEGLLLTNVCTDTAWFVDMWTLPLCFVRGRLRFTRDGHDGESPRYANVLAYVGQRPERFAEVFRGLGHVVLPRRPALLAASA